MSATLTTLVSFDGIGNDGEGPRGDLILDANGDLFGTTTFGGPDDSGTVFELVKGSSGYTLNTLVSFTGTDGGTNGARPRGSLIADANGDLFGTTSFGGADGNGTVFELVKGTSGYTLSTLVSFTGANGAGPWGSLIADANGDLFGTTAFGGTVFELVKSGSSYTLSTLASTGGDPTGSLIADAKGDLFGTTQSGGAIGDGTVFELVKGSSGYTLNTLVSFTGIGGANPGAEPHGSLIADANGNLFGTTYFGGAGGNGTVFELVKGTSGYTLSTLVNFTGGTDGGNPNGSLIADAKGDLFGTTFDGGADQCGTVFELVKSGSSYTLKTLVSFTGTDGAGPDGSLITDAKGNLFGTTALGGSNNGTGGTAFEITNSGFVVVAITGTEANQQPLPLLPFHPFGQVVIGDNNPGQTETVTITRVENAGNALLNLIYYGLLTDPNAATDGSHNANGVYTVTASVSAVTAALQGLLGTRGLDDTHYTVQVTDILGATATDTTTSIIGILDYPHNHMI